MVLFFTSAVHDPAITIYMGKDKFENEDLIKYAWPQDIWFHVDKLSSAHVYLRMPEGMTWDKIPEVALVDCAQLVKANSIEGNKKDNITIIYTPGDNLKKSGDMAVGQVSFHSDKRVKRVYIPKRDNVIVNRLNKTKVEREVDHEQERVDRLKKEGAVKRAAAAAQKKAEADLAAQRAADKAARSYDLLDTPQDDDEWNDYTDVGNSNKSSKPQKSVREMEEDFM